MQIALLHCVAVCIAINGKIFGKNGQLSDIGNNFSVAHPAENDLFEIYKFVYSNDSEENAERLYDKLYQKCLTLQEIPEKGHIPPELRLLEIEDFLEVHYKPYRIIYQIIKEEVFIYCILDGRREIQKLLQERLIRG
ncbi:MAG: type II toxin-antitoxin system RelE/ParE family toxin [Ignavibacteriaceae bacterium]